MEVTLQGSGRSLVEQLGESSKNTQNARRRSSSPEKNQYQSQPQTRTWTQANPEVNVEEENGSHVCIIACYTI